MAQQRGRTELQPRSEAGPIRNKKQLTAEQRSAGEQAAALLRAMAKAIPPARRPPPEARRFLPVIDEARTNHVVLLDGDRGSGKSALLLTLLTGYSETLLKGQPPPDFDDWFDPTDRIVPVGLVDLQPQPSSTNLLFLLMGSLERVVHTLWPQRERGQPRTQPWHVPAADEPTSLRLWRNFVRVAASSGGGNVQDRKKMLDPEAFAIEQVNEDIRRLDLQAVFREFMDALAQDYLDLTHQNSGPKPLFLLAIDDADMNPWLSAHLLEVLRKLYHPRLAFLLTGHSSLFVEMLRQELARDIQRGSGAAAEDTRFRTLALDIYAKVIPQGHRCSLNPLPEGERLPALPELAELLGHIPIQPHSGLGTEQTLSLRDYLQNSSQVRESLPERLRTLWDLYGELVLSDERVRQTESEESRAAAVIEAFWQFVLSNAPLEPGLKNSLQGVIHRSEQQLRVEDGLVATPFRRTLDEQPVSKGWQLVVETPERFYLALRGTQLDPQTTAAIILATDFAADDVRGAFTLRSPAILDSDVPVFAHAIGSLAPGAQLMAPWPIPEWESFEDLHEMKTHWELGLVFAGERPTLPDYLARHFLSAVLSVGKRPRFATKPNVEQAQKTTAATSAGSGTQAEKLQPKGTAASPPACNTILDWKPLVDCLAATARETPESPRLSALSSWALSRAGLLAAPESGLPSKIANDFLRLLHMAFGKDWERARTELRKTRRARLQVDLLQEGFTPDHDYWLERIDEVFSEYDFGSVVEARPSRRAPEKQLERFKAALDRIQIPWLRSTTGDSKSTSLLLYLTAYRLKLLEEAPPAFFEQAAEILLRFRNISGEAAPALVALWRFAASWSSTDEHLQNAVREKGGALVIDRRLLKGITGQKRLLAAHRSSGRSTQTVRLWAAADLQTDMSELHVWATPSDMKDLTPLLEVILRMVHDYSMDQQGRDKPMLFPRIVEWPGSRFRLLNYKYLPWAIPNWPTLLEKELLEPAWNEMVANVKRTNPSGVRGEGGKYVDALAYWLIHSTQMLSKRMSLQTELNMALRPYDWEQVIKPFFTQRNAPHEARDSLFDAWITQLPLMAAPEYGLSQVAVDAILGSVREEIAKDARARLRLLHLREDRLVHAGISRPKVKDFLRSLDNARKDHPWVLLMQKPRPPRPGPRRVRKNHQS